MQNSDLKLNRFVNVPLSTRIIYTVQYGSVWAHR